MKQFFLSAALLIGASLSFTACNNGTYDTDPASNNSGAGNPFNNGNGGSGGSGGSGGGGNVSIGAGTIQFKANGSSKSFNLSGAAVSSSDLLTMAANASATAPYEAAQIIIGPYSGVGAYEDTDTSIASLAYSKINAGGGFDFVYGGLSESPGFKINVTVDDGSVVKGTFAGKIYGGAGTTDDSLVITDGQFNLPKIQTP